MRTPSATQPCSTAPVLRVLSARRASIIVIMVHKKHPLMWFRQQKSLKKCLKSHTLYVVRTLHRHLCHGNIAMARPGNTAYCGTRANAAMTWAGAVYEGLGMNKCHSAHPVWLTNSQPVQVVANMREACVSLARA